MDDMKQAHALCDGSLRQAGQSAYRWLVRGEIMVAAGQDMDRYCFDKAQELDPDWLVPLEAARVELYYRRPGRALARIRRALEVAPDAPYVWYVQGVCQAEFGLSRARVTVFSVVWNSSHATQMPRSNCAVCRDGVGRQ